MIKRYLISLTGIVIYAISLNNLLILNIGKRPQDLLILTLERIAKHLSYVTVYLIVELFFLLLLIIFIKKLHSNLHEIIVSLISIIFLSFLIKFTSALTFNFHGIVAFLSIMLFLNFGLSLMAYANIIITPLDKFLLHISKLIPFSYGHTRLAFDTIIFLLVVIINLFLYQTNIFNWQTVILIITSGPIIHYYEKIFTYFFKINLEN